MHAHMSDSITLKPRDYRSVSIAHRPPRAITTSGRIVFLKKPMGHISASKTNYCQIFQASIFDGLGSRVVYSCKIYMLRSWRLSDSFITYICLIKLPSIMLSRAPLTGLASQADRCIFTVDDSLKLRVWYAIFQLQEKILRGRMIRNQLPQKCRIYTGKSFHYRVKSPGTEALTAFAHQAPLNHILVPTE